MLSADMKSAFDLLGVAPDADPKEIRAAWRALVRAYHPDQMRDNKAEANRRLAEINTAFDLVSAWDPAQAKAWRKRAAEQQARANSAKRRAAKKAAEEEAKAAKEQADAEAERARQRAEAAKKAADAARTRAADLERQEAARRTARAVIRRAQRHADPEAANKQNRFLETLRALSPAARPKHQAFA